ncbi:hypothetical protein LNP20_19630 [Klebsiella pneumoniae subsp. pneumoniae]|nr:hypothetical protein [Klebsiella pneumoniae subsp. pneumoniae]
MINLQRLDLNLLRTLDVLLSENNVTRAAQRLRSVAALGQHSASQAAGDFRRSAADAGPARHAAHRPR